LIRFAGNRECARRMGQIVRGMIRNAIVRRSSALLAARARNGASYAAARERERRSA
jgi:hypothetical protein